ncbi:hypothetical protein EJB05_12526, partial [Eragrostis curvula]
MSLTSAVEWWEESQLRVLVLGSLILQWFLFLSSAGRSCAIPGWFRSLIWLAYLGSDALAIYGLATLFNRHKNHDRGDSRVLEVVWAPVFLMHLGGQDAITAYNIEDNEIWRRYVLTSVSQITVAIYVFCKSWPGGDNNLLAAATLLFIIGVLRCLEKPRALKSASINSLVSASGPAERTTNKEAELQDFVRRAKVFITDHDRHPQQAHSESNDDDSRDALLPSKPLKLFVDHASPYKDRLSVLESLWLLDENEVHCLLRKNLIDVFALLYTKIKMAEGPNPGGTNKITWKEIWSGGLRNLCMYLPWAAIGLFQHSNRKAYNGIDVKITYILFSFTAVMEFIGTVTTANVHADGLWHRMVSQYSLVGFFVRNKKYTKTMSVVKFLGFKDFIDQHWCMKSCCSADRVTGLVLGHVKAGWKHHIHDVASFRMFNDHRGHLTLKHNRCDQDLGWSLKKPFDESVLLWHIATDLCFYDTDPLEMSNYMMYLLFVNPEMLLPGSRRNLFTTAYAELEGLLKGQEPSLEEGGLTKNIIDRLQSIEEGSQEGFIHDAWALAKGLKALGDEKKMWEVIQGVWVEMLCFSAGRCRGYLHAKALGTGGELLTYVWLLLSSMGMETLTERLQREDHPGGQGNTEAASEGVPTSATSSTSEVRIAVDL